MFPKVEEIEARFDELEGKLALPDVIKDQKVYQKYAKEHRGLEPIVSAFREMKEVREEMEGNLSLLNDPDPELAKLARDENSELEGRMESLEERIRLLLLPKDPHDERNTILEIRAGTGGEE
ncbi:MAG: PCRF domain-containing protein, partial [Desulfatiglandaceae bacterium]